MAEADPQIRTYKSLTQEEGKSPELPAKATNMKCMFSQGLFKEIAFVGKMSHSRVNFIYYSYSK